MRRQPQASWASSAWPPLSTGSSAHAERLDGNTEGTSECLCLSKLAQISRVVHIPQDSNAGQPWYSLLEQLEPLRGQLRRVDGSSCHVVARMCQACDQPVTNRV